MANKEDLIKLLNEVKDNSISLHKFLINYCGVHNEKMHDLKIGHHHVKHLMPNIKRVGFEELLKRKNEIYMGNIIIVKDSFGNIAPYINPMLEIDKVSEIDFEIIKTDTKMEEIIIDEHLNIYELSKLCRYFKEHHKSKEYREAHKLLLEEKEPSSKQYKKEKYNLMMKGREEYDKY